MWWIKNPERLRLERVVLRQSYPQAVFAVSHGQAVILASVRTARDEYVLEVLYPARFPHETPAGYLLRPKPVGGTPHYFRTGQLCLYGYGETGPETSGCMVLDWAVAWVRAYETWRNRGGQFPPITEFIRK